MAIRKLRLIFVMVLIFVLKLESNGNDTLRVSLEGKKLTIIGQNLFKVSEDFKNFCGDTVDYLVYSCLISGKDLEEDIKLKTVVGEGDIFISLYDQRVILQEYMPLPVIGPLANEDCYNRPSCSGVGCMKTYYNTFYVEKDSLKYSREINFNGYSFSKIEMDSIKYEFDRESERVRLFSEMKYDLLRERFQDDRIYPTYFYWCLFVAKWNEDEEFELKVKKLMDDYKDIAGSEIESHQAFLESISKAMLFKKFVE